MDTNQRRVGNYELQERLRYGAGGEVWKAFNTQQHRYFAVKIIPVDADMSADFAPGFYREAQILAALQHPNIVPVQDYRLSQSGSEGYLIMDDVQGPSLADYLSASAHAGKIPPPAEIVRLLTPIAAALDYAHQRGVIHGALQPAYPPYADGRHHAEPCQGSGSTLPHRDGTGYGGGKGAECERAREHQPCPPIAR